MSPGRPGRVPAIIELLKRAKRPMHIREIAALFRDQGDETCNHKVIGATLSGIVRTKPDIGIRRGKNGYYVYHKEYDVPISSTRSRSDDLAESPRVAEIRAARRTRLERTEETNALPEADENSHHLMDHDVRVYRDIRETGPVPFTRIRIVRTLPDGRVLFTDDPTGRAWVAKEV